MHVDAVETARMAIYLNAALAGHPIERFWGDGARFVSEPGGNIFASDPREWLATQTDCRSVQTRMRWDESSSQLPIWFQAFHWVLKARVGDVVTAWRPSYEIQDQPGSTKRLWLVTYYPEIEGNDAKVSGRKLGETIDELSLVLKSLIELTGRRIAGWRNTFSDLLAQLEGRSPERMKPPVPPDVLGVQPRRLIETAFSAQIFTGMGNWGDNMYDPDIQPTVEKLTASLFILLADGLMRAVDMTTPNVR
jgi:hypothetical protein